MGGTDTTDTIDTAREKAGTTRGHPRVHSRHDVRRAEVKAMLADPAVAGSALTRAVAGCLDWQRHMLQVPEAVPKGDALGG